MTKINNDLESPALSKSSSRSRVADRLVAAQSIVQATAAFKRNAIDQDSSLSREEKEAAHLKIIENEFRLLSISLGS